MTSPPPTTGLQHIRAAVRFADSIRYANSTGASHFIEVGPGGGLTSSIEESLADVDVASVPLLRKDRPEPTSLMAGVAQAFVSGVGVDWRATLPGAGFVELPTYAFERRRFWLSADDAAVDAEGLGLAASEHALLGAVVDLPTSGGVVLTGRLSAQSQSWLNDHAVGGVVIFPGAGFVELAIRAGDEVGCSVVDELMLAAPLVIPSTGSVSVQVVVDGADESGHRALSVFSRADVHSGWTLHAEGIVRPGAADSAADLTAWPPPGATPVDIDGLYDRLAARGYGYGPAFQGLTAMWRRGDEVFADVSLPGDAGVSPTGFGVHPAVLDAALHAMIVATEADHDGKDGVLVPFSWQGVSLHAAGASSVRARITPSGPSSVSVELADALGLPVLSVAAMVARPVSRRAVDGRGVRFRPRPDLRSDLVARGIRLTRRHTVLRRIRIAARRRRCAGLDLLSDSRGAGRAADMARGARLRNAGGFDARRGRAAGGGRHRPGRCRRVGSGAFRPDRTPGPDRTGGFRCATERYHDR